MRKTWKRALSAVLSAAMVLGMGGVGAATNEKAAKAAEDAKNVAYLSFADNSWSVQYWNDGKDYAPVVATTAEVTGAGQYTVGLDFTGTDAGAVTGGIAFMDLEVSNGEEDYAGYTIKIDSLKVNGEEATFTKGYTSTDDEKTTRMNIYNGWVSGTPAEQPAKNAVRSYDGVISDASATMIDPMAYDSIKTIEVTFTYAEGSAVAPEVPAVSDAPVVTTVDFDATINCFGNFYGWDASVPEDATATVHVSEYGEYTVSMVAPDAFDDLNEMSGAFVVNTTLAGEPTDFGFTLVPKTVKIADATYDWSKGTAYKDGDCLRMSVRNEWGTEENANPLAGQIVPINKDDVIAFTFEVKEGAPTSGEGEATPEPTPEAAKEYHAYIGVQTDTWDYRDEWEKDAKSTIYDFFKQMNIGGGPQDVTYTDVTITENGEYTVAVDGADLSTATKFNMLFISTDIPCTMSGVKATNAVVTIDGTEVAKLDVAPIKKECIEGGKKYYMFMVNNVYANEGDIDAPAAYDYVMPEKSVSIKFTIEGVDFASSYEKEVVGLKKGKTFTAGNFVYKVTKASTKVAGKVSAGTVEVAGLSKAGKKKASVAVPATIKNAEASYKVTAIGAKAFKNAKKVTKVSLGKNVKKIGKEAFAGCVKLAKLKVAGKLSSVAKNAFKGCKKTIKVFGASKKANVKKLVKSGYKKFK